MTTTPTPAGGAASTTMLRDVIEIPKPDEISDSDLVLKLSDAVADPAALAETVRDYVVTDQLVEHFDEALSLIRTSLTGQSSKAAYLHGSFGSGKSHFMAVLYAILNGNQAARSRAEFASLLDKHDAWLAGKKIMMVPYHMLDAKSLEQRVLGGYVAHIRKLHPGAPIPQVYRTDALFDDIRQLRANVGDETFISKLPGAVDEDDEWGDSAFWNSERLDVALSAPEPEDTVSADLLNPSSPSDFRAKLVNDAIAGWFPGYVRGASENEAGFISLDRGLAVIAEHAKALGYDALVLFLDELILWLASSIHDTRFVATESRKITNFVESGDTRRAIPVASFIARQRDLRDFVGDTVEGSAEMSIQQTLNLAKGRFDVITLEDRNLPAVARARVLRRAAPQAESNQKIEAAFQNIQRVRPDVWDVLIGTDDRTTGSGLEAFRLTYPFSPVFMDTLVHVSNALQRNRTGLKLMRNLLAEHRDELRLGQIIPIGDLFGEIAKDGDEPFTEQLRAEFKSARKLYDSKMRPMLLLDADLTEDDLDRARLRPDEVDSSLATKVARFTTDERLMRTLLLSALAPSVPAFKGLTAKRLNALNYGFVRSQLRGQEDSIVVRRVKEWAGKIPEIKVGDGADPGIGLELVDVDYESVIDRVRTNGSPGNVKALVKRMLWNEFGVEDNGQTADLLNFPWRGSSRSVEMLFGNIADEAELREDQFAPINPGLWRFVIDMPFDDGRSPTDDRARLQRMHESGFRKQTIAWVPAHFTEGTRKDLVRLTIIDWLLTGSRFDQNSAHLSPDNRERAKAIISSQRDTLQSRVKEALRQAYGLAQKDSSMVKDGYDEHFIPLTTATIKPPGLAQSFHQAIRTLADGALAHQFPAHPDFDPDNTGVPVRTADIRLVSTYLRQAFEDGPGDRVEVPRKDQPLMRRVAERLKLGKMHEAYFELHRHWTEHFDRRAAAEPGPLRIADLRSWIDQPEPYGLETHMANLVIVFFADQTDRVWTQNGGEISVPDLTQIRDHFALRSQPLPDEQTWAESRSRAQKIFGFEPPKLPRGRLVAQFAETLGGRVRDYEDAVHNLVDVLEKNAGRLGLDVRATEGRLHTARLAAILFDGLAAQKNSVSLLKYLVTADLGGPAEHLGRSVKSAKEVTTAVSGTAWDFIEPARTLPEPFATEVEVAFSELHSVARSDEFLNSLPQSLRRLREEIVKITKRANAARAAAAPAPQPSPGGQQGAADPSDAPAAPAAPPTIMPESIAPTFPPGRPADRPARRSGTKRGSVQQVRAQLSDLAGALDELSSTEPDATVEITWRVVE